MLNVISGVRGVLQYDHKHCKDRQLKILLRGLAFFFGLLRAHSTTFVIIFKFRFLFLHQNKSTLNSRAVSSKRANGFWFHRAQLSSYSRAQVEVYQDPDFKWSPNSQRFCRTQYFKDSAKFGILTHINIQQGVYRSFIYSTQKITQDRIQMEKSQFLFSDNICYLLFFLQRTFQEGLQTIGQLQLGNPVLHSYFPNSSSSNFFFIKKIDFPT